jgi:beta-carotene hydroxylase
MPASNPVHSTRDAPRPPLPSLTELGGDLLRVSAARLLLTVAAPFAMMASFALFAWFHWWPLAVASVMALSFVTYGSTCHDLVHRTLGLPRALNDFLLSLIELLSLRSGTAYRLSHLHHHARLLTPDDVEGASAHGSFWGAIVIGPTMQMRLWLWAWRQNARMRPRLCIEGIGILSFLILAIAVTPWNSAPLVYVALVIAGSWFFPLVTVYIPHDGHAKEPLTQTRLFRGRLIQLIACGHLYHLEHHLYPSVPHHHWKTLADRLDPYFEQRGISPFG